MDEERTKKTQDFSTFPRAGNMPPASGRIRVCPEDFEVIEELCFEPDDEGEHLLLQIQKTDANTDWIAGWLARTAGIPKRDVSYAGLKDRRAVATQWFSIRLAGKPEPDWTTIDIPGARILRARRHRRKLRRGALLGNRFRIRVRDLKGDPKELEHRLNTAARVGVPNYFGQQRFGREESNLVAAERLFSGQIQRPGRHRRGIYLSAARSFLFNLVLAKRVTRDDWNRVVPGDLVMLDGSHSHFPVEQPDAEIRQRTRQMDIHPTGPLWGRGNRRTSGEARAVEDIVLATHGPWCEGLERFGLDQDRRPLRTVVRELSWDFVGKSILELKFELDPGCYATVVLRELMDFEEG